MAETALPVSSFSKSLLGENYSETVILNVFVPIFPKFKFQDSNR